MNLTPIATIDLDHRAFHMSRAADCLAVASQDGHISLIHDDFRVDSMRLARQKLQAIALDPSSDLMAISTNRGLSVIDRKGKAMFTTAAPPLVADTPSRVPTDFSDCLFAPSNHSLWSVAPHATHQLEVQRRAPGNWSQAQSLTLEDPYGDSSYSLHAIPNSSDLALWVAAGQDGQGVYWLSYDGQLKGTLEQQLEDTTPPDFAPSGAEFLVLAGYDTIRRYTYPGLQEIGHCLWPPEIEDDTFGCSIAYIDKGHAIVSSNNGRIFLLELETMTLSAEVFVTNHEPHPAQYWYPQLKGDQSLCTDLSYFRGFEEIIVAVYRRDGGTGLSGWKDSLLVFSTRVVGEAMAFGKK